MVEQPMVKGGRYRIVREFGDLGLGEEFTYVGVTDYLDWFKCVVLVARDVGGEATRGVGYGLPNYCERIPGPVREVPIGY